MKSTRAKKQAQLVDNIIEEIRQSGQKAKPKLINSITQLVSDYYKDDQPSKAREVTVLLSDIRGFSAMSERFEAPQIIAMLNRYFSKMNEIIVKYDGVIDKYMGDTIMAYFGETGQGNDHAHRAIQCAVEMQNAMDEVNDENSDEGLPLLYMGIGINTGIVSAGQVGSDLHNEYAVIGDGINLASRIESHSLRGQILISEYTYQKVRDVVEIGDINAVHVKGKSDVIHIYEITASDWQEKTTVPMREIRHSVRVKLDADFHFQVIENDEVQPGNYFGHVMDISYNGIFALIKQPLDVLTEIKIPLSLSLFGDETHDVYGKIKSIRETEDGYGCGIEFTFLDDDSQDAIKEYIDRVIEGS